MNRAKEGRRRKIGDEGGQRNCPKGKCWTGGGNKSTIGGVNHGLVYTGEKCRVPKYVGGTWKRGCRGRKKKSVKRKKGTVRGEGVKVLGFLQAGKGKKHGGDLKARRSTGQTRSQVGGAKENDKNCNHLWGHSGKIGKNSMKWGRMAKGGNKKSNGSRTGDWGIKQKRKGGRGPKKSNKTGLRKPSNRQDQTECWKIHKTSGP